MSDIRAGDVVVCVPGDCGGHADQGPSRLTIGRYYTALGIVPPEEFGGGCIAGLIVAEMRQEPNGSGFCLARFRKLLAADELFTEQMRACRPAKQRVPVRAGQS